MNNKPKVGDKILVSIGKANPYEDIITGIIKDGNIYITSKRPIIYTNQFKVIQLID